MNKIRMEHPDLPGQPIWVFPQATPVWNFSGWQEAPEPPPEPRKSPAGEESASAAAVPAERRTAESAARVQPAPRRRVVEPTTSTEE